MAGNSSQGARIHAEIAAKLNFAAHQSSFPVLRNLQVENLHAEERLDDIILTLRANPPFVKEKVWFVDRIAPQGLVSIKDRDLKVDGAFLLNLTESMRGDVMLRVEKDGVVLAELSKPVELLAYNEWGGAGYMPELLAAFSMPNDPAVDRILRGASEVLRRAGKRDQIDGYESRSRQRVWEIVSAIYTAIANLGLTYAVPPASFEHDGQKIRLPGQILDGGVATCLDMAMLFASAFEQAAVNPIIALPKGHALVGVWLQPEDFSTIVIDEAETIRKRIGLRELVLIETTCVTSHPAPPFSKAVKAANGSIRPEKDDIFTAAVDIRRARVHRIMPLGLKSKETAPSDEKPTTVEELTLEEAPMLPGFDSTGPEEEPPETPQGRLGRWQRKLLDLTLNNRLLHHRSTKASLLIISPNPGRLEDKLAKGVRIQISPVPSPSVEGQDKEFHRQRAGEVITEEYALNELERRRVLVDLPADELSKRTVEIYRKAQTALQEGGANTLYLAIGFLLWKRNEKDDRRFRAPLILHPVALERKSARSGVRMVAYDDEPSFNTTLLEMLRRDFRIDIRGLDGELPEDESGIDVDGIWNRVRRAVKEAPGFEVVEDVVLGHFSFAKYLMWKDLVDRTDALRKNRVVRHLIDAPSDPYANQIGFVEPSQVDREYKPSDLLTPLPADSSQMAAIATADRGKDFIIIGPPGTGKSQTISNLIAHMLGKGKTVLFLSEKTAALEVVYRRLEKIGLGRFCLELHSNKVRKIDVLNQLRSAWETTGIKSVADWQEQAAELRTLRDRLNRVVDHLHKKRRNGLTAHYAIGVKVRDEEIASRVTLSWSMADHHDETVLKFMHGTVENLQIQFKAVRDINQSPFHLVAGGEWSPQWESRVVELAKRLSATAKNVELSCETFCEAVDIALPDHSMKRLDALSELATLLVYYCRKPTECVLESDSLDRIETINEAVVRLKRYAEDQASLSCVYKLEWQKKVEELRLLRDLLTRVADHLHKKHRNGLTAHYAVGVKVRDEELASRVNLSWPTADQHEAVVLKAMHDVVEKLSIQAKAVGDVSQSPFHLVASSKWTPQWEGRVVELVERLSATARTVEHSCETLCEAVGIALPDRSMTRLDALSKLANLLVDSYRKPTAYALEPDGPDRIEALEEAFVRLKAYAAAQASLSCAYEPFAWRILDGEEIGRRWAEAKPMWWPKRFFVRRSIVKEMRVKGAQGKPDPTHDAQTLTRLRREGGAIDRLDSQLSDFKAWKAHTTEPAAVESLRRLGERVRAAVGELADAPRDLVEWRVKVRTLLHDGNDLLAPGGVVERKATAFLEALENLKQAIIEFGAVASSSLRDAVATTDRPLDQLWETAETIAVRRSELRNWCAWRKHRAKAIDVDLLPLVEAVEQGRIPSQEIKKTFEAAYCTWWSAAVIEEDKVLHTFSTPARKAVIAKFRKINSRFQEIIAQSISTKLADILADAPQRLTEAQAKVRALLDDGNDLLAAGGVVECEATAFLGAFENLQQASSEFEAVAGTAIREAFASSKRALEQLRETADTVAARRNELRDWCAWRKRRAEAIDAGLFPLVKAVEQGRVPAQEIKKTFEAAYCTWWSAAVIGEDEVLRTFSMPEHEATIAKFREVDENFLKLAAAFIAAKLAGILPKQDDVQRSSQWGVVRRELQKQRRHKPVRQLLKEAPDVLTSLTPCFMMSPLSVAQYLPPDQALFDVVIFDEASQITVWDAVGSIARGRQVIIAGDPKQMPPTNFFARSDDDPDGDVDTEGDLDSILEEMLGGGIPQTTLNLHYRSRKESLIAFSNDRYYDNRLITFPAPAVTDHAVTLVQPGGFYARGGARHNEGEANTIVNEIVRRLTHPVSAIRDRSIGVVTFNSEQQTLIENLLDKVRSQQPEIEWAFSRERQIEPVFVKNLETVQGDERDVILFSVTYGPDLSGHVTMNFGPLNRQGGERRLNVALTRARSEMIVFSTLNPDHIDLSRTQARAVIDLKHFLEYAKKGRSALGSVVTGSMGDFESPFEESVSRELRTKGWQVHSQIGVSAYRIDLGIVHPDAAGRYLAGVECDGAMYHSSAFARERDKIRQAVLEGLGWTLFRIWSTDYWTNKVKVLADVDNALRRYLEDDRQCSAEQAKTLSVPSVEHEEIHQVRPDTRNPDGQREGTSHGSSIPETLADEDILESESAEPSKDTGKPKHHGVSATEQHSISDQMTLEAGSLAPYASFTGMAGPDPRQVNTACVADSLCQIIKVEGPMLAKRSYEIYLSSCGLRRMGPILKRLMNKALQHAIRNGRVVNEDELDNDDLAYSTVRLTGAPPVVVRDRGPRDFDEIPPSEIQFVARRLVEDGNLETGSDVHLRAVLDFFNLTRLTVQVRTTLLFILDCRYAYVDEVIVTRKTTESAEPSEHAEKPKHHGESATEQHSMSDQMTLEAGSLAPYASFTGTTGPDPRQVNEARVADGLCQIIKVEGPMLAKRSYEIYLSGCGLRRMGPILKRLMNKALQHAIRNGRVVNEDELDKGGLVYSTVRLTRTPPVVVRDRGPRSFDEIPPSEIQFVARRLVEDGNLEAGSDVHLKAVLDFFNLTRLTVQVRTTLLFILDCRYPYVDEAIDPKKLLNECDTS